MIPIRDRRNSSRSGPGLAGIPRSGVPIPRHDHSTAQGGAIPEGSIDPGSLLVRQSSNASILALTATDIDAATLTLSGLLTLSAAVPRILIGLGTVGFESGDQAPVVYFPEGDGTSIVSVRLVGTDLAQVDLTGQTGDIAAATLLTDEGVPGIWQVSVLHTCTSAGSAGTLATTIRWTDANGAQSVKPAADLDLTGTGYAGGSALIEQASAANDITYETAITGGAGSPAYRLAIRLTLLG